MIPSFNTNNTTPANIRYNTAATQDNQASTNTSLTTTNWNSSFTVNSAPRPRNMASSVFSKIAIGIGILCRSIAYTAAETIESSTPTATSVRNIATTADTASVESSSQITGLQAMLIALIAIGVGGSTILFFIRVLGIFSPQQGTLGIHPPQQRTRVPQQPRITEADNLIIDKFYKLKYKDLPVVEINIKDIRDKDCLICLSHVDKNASLTNLRSAGNNESMATEDKWVIYKEQFYHIYELQEAVAANRRIPHTQEFPEISELKAVKIVQGLNDIPNTNVESTTKKPESFIVDIPENQDTSQFTENDNDEESTAFLETAF